MAKEKTSIGRLFADGRRIDAVVKAAARQAMRLHARKNIPLVVWRDGKVALISPAALRESLRIKKK